MEIKSKKAKEIRNNGVVFINYDGIQYEYIDIEDYDDSVIQAEKDARERAISIFVKTCNAKFRNIEQGEAQLCHYDTKGINGCMKDCPKLRYFMKAYDNAEY